MDVFVQNSRHLWIPGSLVSQNSVICFSFVERKKVTQVTKEQNR